MFENNKYANWYRLIIESAQSQHRIKTAGYEKHHIIPRCLGGSNASNNLVLLTHREHYICHLLLCKMTDDRTALRKLANAFELMSNTRAVTARRYQFIKTLINREGKNNWFYGQKHNEESKKKIRAWGKGKRTGSDNPMFGRIGKLNQSSRAVIINEIEYESLTIAAHSLGVHVDTVKYRIRTMNNYRYKNTRVRKIQPAPKKPVCICGVIYSSSREAADTLGMLPESLRYRCKSSGYPDWYYI